MYTTGRCSFWLNKCSSIAYLSIALTTVCCLLSSKRPFAKLHHKALHAHDMLKNGDFSDITVLIDFILMRCETVLAILSSPN